MSRDTRTPAVPSPRRAQRPPADEDASCGVRVHVGRQPICHPDRSVHGYELLFRSGHAIDRATVVDDRATSTVLVTAMLELGLEAVAGQHPTFVNIPREFAVGDLPLPFPAAGIVLELLEDVPADAEVVRGLRRLVGEGFRIALDDFEWDQARVELMPLASYVKVDIVGKADEELASTVARLSQFDVLTVAERVETAEDAARCVAVGFDLMQGYHFLRPATLSAQTVSPAHAAALELVATLSRRDADLHDIEALVRRDPGLSHRILRAVNSAAAGTTRPVDSLHSALVLLGTDRLLAWATLLALALDEPGDEAVASSVMARGRFCQTLASGRAGVNPGSAFLVGMLSGLADALHVTPLTVAEKLPLAPPVMSALLIGAGPLGEVLRAAEAFERPHSDGPHAGGALTTADVCRAYLSAIAWTEQFSMSGAAR